MKQLVILLGGVSAVLYIFPGLVIFGYLMLFLPGFILSLVPTLFVYCLATYLIRPLLPITNDMTAYGFAALIALALGVIVMQPFRLIASAKLADMRAEDIISPAPIALSGDIYVEGIGMTVNTSVGANKLYTKIMQSPQVDSLTIKGNGRTRTWVRSSSAYQAEPYVDGIKPDSFDYTLRFAYLDNEPTQRKQFEIAVIDGDGEYLFRRHTARVQMPWPIFFIEYVMGSASGGFAERGWRIAGTLATTNGKLWERNSEWLRDVIQ